MADVSVVVPYRPDGGHRDRLWDWVSAWWRTWFPDYEMIIADSGDEPFNRGASRNAAVRRATGSTLIIADADTIPHPPGVETAVQFVAIGSASWVIPYETERYYNLSETATRRRLQFEPNVLAPISEPWDEDDWEHKITSWAGCLIVPRSSFWAAGGYPEFERWGYEDDCFRTALDFVAGHHIRLPGFALHLWHPASEADRFGNPDIEANRRIFMEYKQARTHQQMTAVIERHGARA